MRRRRGDGSMGVGGCSLCVWRWIKINKVKISTLVGLTAATVAAVWLAAAFGKDRQLPHPREIWRRVLLTLPTAATAAREVHSQTGLTVFRRAVRVGSPKTARGAGQRAGGLCVWRCVKIKKVEIFTLVGLTAATVAAVWLAASSGKDRQLLPARNLAPSFTDVADSGDGGGAEGKFVNGINGFSEGGEDGITQNGEGSGAESRRFMRLEVR